MSKVRSIDVLIVGGGNAALCAALSAREQGVGVLVLERAPEALRAGNTAFTAGAMRVAYRGVEDVLRLVPDLSDEDKANTEFGSYTEEQFLDDLGRVTEYRCDPDLSEILVKRSFETLLWMRSKGVRFGASYGRQAFKVGGRFRFWGGLAIEAWGGGPGLVDALFGAAAREGIEVCYGATAEELLRDDRGVVGVAYRMGGKRHEVHSKSVVLASGGFQANVEWRTRYLGANWDLAKVRGTQFNTGDGIRMALDIGASSSGHWSSCHAVGWDRNAPEFGDLSVGDGFQKHSYPFGIMINARGQRFVDEGADFRNYTYAKYGREILAQPGQFAWQIFDQRVSHLLRDEYRIRQVTKQTANNIVDLVARLDDVDGTAALETIRAYNSSVMNDVPFDPTVKDGRGTRGLAVPKSNWANALEEPPFEAYAVTCGITFTFGGLRIDTEARVLDAGHEPIPGLYAAGEIVGGIFYFNYPGGTGLTNGAVFGRIGGAGAGIRASGIAA